MKKKIPLESPKIKLDLSYGELPPNHPFIRPAGFDPLKFPWKLADASVEEASCLYLFQRIPAKQRGPFMDELWRVLVPAGKATFIVPYWNNARAVQDPLAEWPPICEQSFLYFNKKFREDNKLDYGMKSDFDFVYGYNLDGETTGKNEELRAYWIKHLVNAINDLHMTLTKR